MSIAAEQTEYTTGQLVAKLGVPVHRIEYCILARGLRPARRVGRYRLFTRAQAQAIAEALGVHLDGNGHSRGVRHAANQ